jgi:myo-inositol 2-dehydrogenase/D-chiro-inositol 1-dehydrogenase
MQHEFYLSVNLEFMFLFLLFGGCREGEMIKFGLLGAGRIGRIHGANAAARGRLTAVFDVDAGAAKEVAERHGAHVRPLEAIISASDVDALLICTPTDTHADLIEAGVKAGKAVFCEKPVDLSAERVRACLKVVEASGKPLMIGFNRRFDPSFAQVEARVRAGEIGAVELVTIISKDPSPPPASYAARSGGIFRDMMIHDLDMARFLLGEEPVEVFATASSLVDPAIGEAGDFDTAVVTLKTASGKIAHIANSRRAAYGYDQRIEAHGAKGGLFAGNRTQTSVSFGGTGGFSSDPALPFFLERYEQAYRAELDAFVRCLETGAAPSPSGLDGLKALVLADAATASAKTGQPVRL